MVSGSALHANGINKRIGHESAWFYFFNAPQVMSAVLLAQKFLRLNVLNFGEFHFAVDVD